jgi:hypothetical protein
MQTEILETNTAFASDLELEVTIQIADLHADWKRISLLANYLAEYVAYQFPQRERAENLFSTITNEIVEAVANLAPHQSNLLLRCRHSDHGLTLDVKHEVKSELQPSFVLFVQKLSEDQDDEAYLRMLTSETRPEAYFNQLGLTMLAHDFDVRMTLNAQEKSNHFCTHIDVLDEVFSR